MQHIHTGIIFVLHTKLIENIGSYGCETVDMSPKDQTPSQNVDDSIALQNMLWAELDSK